MRKQLSLFLAFLIPLVILLAGLLGAGLYGFKAFPELLVEAGRGTLPEGFEVELEKPGNFTVWLHERGRDGEKFYWTDGTLPPGGKVYLFDEASGREIPMKSWVSASKNIGQDRAVSLGSFDGAREGQKVEIRGAGFSRPILLSISPTNTSRVLQVVFTLLAIVVLTLTVAICTFILLIHRYRHSVEAENAARPAGAGTGDFD